MYCSNCGKQISDQANFCNYCGAKVTAPQPRTGGPATPRQPQQNTYTAPAQHAPAKKESAWGKRITTALIAVAVYFGAKYATQAFLTRDVEEGDSYAFSLRMPGDEAALISAAQEKSEVQLGLHMMKKKRKAKRVES